MHCHVEYQADGECAVLRRQRLAVGKRSDGRVAFQHDHSSQSTQYPWSGCRADNQGGPVSNGNVENANSFHPGGANMGFADGSVRFIKSSISMNTYSALGTRPTARSSLPTVIEQQRSLRKRGTRGERISFILSFRLSFLIGARLNSFCGTGVGAWLVSSCRRRGLRRRLWCPGPSRFWSISTT